MIDGKRVVAWTPYGREETVSVLLQYLRREHERGIVDEWWLCMNTDDHQAYDRNYAEGLAAFYPWIKQVPRPPGLPVFRQKQRNTGYFYRYMTDPDTVFVRLDDDIVYVHEDAVERLVRHRLEAGSGVASFPVMWNNAIVSWFAQQQGAIPAAGTQTFPGWNKPPVRSVAQPTDGYTWPAVGGPYCMDPVGWADGRFGVALHRLLLDRLEAGEIERCFLYQDIALHIGLQFSVSTFASLGSMYAGLPGGPGILVPEEEESWHTIHEPRRLGQPNVLVGNALVSHYTFFPQGPVIRATNTLARYRDQAKKLT